MTASKSVVLLTALCLFLMLLNFYANFDRLVPSADNPRLKTLHDVISLTKQFSSFPGSVLKLLASEIGEKHLTDLCIMTAYRDSYSPTIYVITPTFSRPEQIPELTRLAQTLMLVPNIVWLVIDDAKVPTVGVEDLLKRTMLNYHYMLAPMPEQYKKQNSKPRGVSNRNKGLEWLRKNAKTGVMYFADDDNTYDISLFEEIRRTKRLSMFPVGLCTQLGVSSPVVVNGTFTGFYDGWIGGRKFPVDMAGFAVNLEFLFTRPKAEMPFKPGREEDGFLKSLAPFEPKEIELLAGNCSKILVWHTQSKKNKPAATPNATLYANSNILILRKQLV